jgi:hypothetical protein
VMVEVKIELGGRVRTIAPVVASDCTKVRRFTTGVPSLERSHALRYEESPARALDAERTPATARARSLRIIENKTFAVQSVTEVQRGSREVE